MRSIIGLSVVTLLCTLGCGFLGDPGSDTTDGVSSEGSGATEVEDLAPPTTLAAVTPTFNVLGDALASPQRIQVSFSRAIVESDTVGQPAVGPTLTPSVPGDWRWTAPDRMTFEPTVGFAPKATYTATLATLETRYGALAGPEVSHTFEVPPLTLARVSRSIVTTKTIDVDVVFTGPVTATQDKAITFLAKGKTLSREQLDQPRPDRLRFRLNKSELGKDEVDLEVRIAEGITSAVDGTTTVPTAKSTLRVDTRVRPMEIRDVRVKETQDGFTLRVLCSDQAVGEEDYWWDREDYDSWELSERCMLSRDALAQVHFEPAVEGVYITEGERGFRVFGNFPKGTLSITIDKGAFTEAGGALEKTWQGSVEIPARAPKVELVAKQGRYLPRGSWGNLPIRFVNTDEVEVTVRHVPPENLVFWMSDDDESADSRTSNIVAKKKIRVKGKADTTTSGWIDVASLVSGAKDGLFEIGVVPVIPDGVPTNWMSSPSGDTSRIVLTDLHLVAKASGVKPGANWSDRIQVWTLGSLDGAAVSGVVIDAVRPSGFVMATCRTGFDGSCELKMPAVDGTDQTPPIALIAKKGDDVTYLKFDDLKTPVSEADVAGQSWTTVAPYVASLYADRGVYRPGDTVHLSTIVRDRAYTAPAGGLPVELIVTDPRRQVIQRGQIQADPNGLAVLDVRLQDFAATGSYKAELKVGGESVSSHDFRVEEFVPERMKVEAAIPAMGALTTDPTMVTIDARYLFGGSAAGSPVEVNCVIEPTRFAPKKSADFHFGPVFVGRDTTPGRLQTATAKAVLNQDGKATASCQGSERGYNGAGRLVAEVAVFEAGSGRSTKTKASMPVHPDVHYVGLKSPVEKAGKGDAIPVQGVLVDWEGNPLQAATTVELIYYRLDEEYGWWWWDDRGEESYDLYLRRVEEGRATAEVGADGTFRTSYTPSSDGAGFLVRAIAGGAKTDLRIEGKERRYSWSNSSRVDRTPRPAKPTALVVVVPERIDPNKAVTAKVDAPYAGRMLFTVETDRLITYEWVDAKPGVNDWTFTVPSFVPDVFVSAFLVKDPKVDSPEGYTPERAFGVERVRVNPAEFELGVAVKVPDEVRSNSVLPIEIDLGAPGANASVTVAAVDEGILQLTNFKSPDPLDDLFARRQLGVTTYETIGWSLLMPAGPSSTHGGDGDGGGGRVQAVKPVALFSGKLTADASGKATVELAVPQYRGKLRVMVVAAQKTKVGHAEASVLVRDPLVLQTTLPRFLVQGDAFQIPVFVTNMSGKDRDVKVEMLVDDLPWPGMPTDADKPAPVTMLGAKSTSVRVENGKSRTVAFQGRADALVGAARFTIKVSSDNLASFETLDVPFAPAGPKQRVVEQVTLAQGNLDLAPQLQGWLPTTEQSTFWVTPNPYGRQMGHLTHLIKYPHGCVEQTTSSTRPLLFVRDLVPALLPELGGDELDKMVKHGIDRVLAMQTSSGGFGYWPGDNSPNTWASVYVTHMLLDAQKQKFDVPQARLDQALSYLEDVIRNQNNNDRYRNAEPYGHYVLALAGRPQKAAAASLLAKLDPKGLGEDAESAYLLKAALHKAGDQRYEADLRNPDVSSLASVRKNSWSFYSDLRRRGMMLSTYHELFGNTDAGAADLAALVARGLENESSHHYTTQELVWGITGLGKRVAGSARDYSGIELLAGGKPLPQAPALANVKNPEPHWAVPRASERDLTLKIGQLGAGRLYLVRSSEGVLANAPVRTGGSGLQLVRTKHDRNGNTVDASKVKLGDVIYTKVAITNTTSDRIQNIALVDRFVAGFELENAALGGAGEIDWVDWDEQWRADYVSMRDDRFEIFGALDAGETKVVVYPARAVTSGTFVEPSVEAEAMYDPSVWARQPGTKVVVQGPWDDVLL